MVYQGYTRPAENRCSNTMISLWSAIDQCCLSSEIPVIPVILNVLNKVATDRYTQTARYQLPRVPDAPVFLLKPSDIR